MRELEIIALSDIGTDILKKNFNDTIKDKDKDKVLRLGFVIEELNPHPYVVRIGFPKIFKLLKDSYTDFIIQLEIDMKPAIRGKDYKINMR